MTTHTTPNQTDTTSSNLYFEARGSGPPVLLIAGTPGDGGQFDALADILADHHLVITYDRIGTSRSATPPGWVATTPAAQADDAARLLRSVSTEPATVYGTSNGAAIALELALRHPSLVSRAVLHEMPLLTVLEDPEPVAAMLGDLIGTAMTAGGPRSALDAFLRFAFGDIVDRWSGEFRNRLLDNAEMVFGVELPAFQAYRPDERALASAHPPLEIAVGEAQLAPFFHEAAQWLATRTNSPLVRTPAAHGPHFSCPGRLAAMLFPTF